MAFSPKHKGALSYQTITICSRDTLLCAGTSQGPSYTLVVPLLLVISEAKDLSNTLVSVLKVEECKMQWDTALAIPLRYGCHTAEHAKSYHTVPVSWVSFIGTSHFKPKEDGF